MLPTETPTPDLTIIPSATPSPTNPPTATPTLAPTLEPTPETLVPADPIATAKIPFRLGREKLMPQAGFSFSTPIGFVIDYRPNQVTMTSDDQDTVFTFLGGRVEREQDLESDFKQFIELIKITPNLEQFQADEFYQVEVSGKPGLAAEVTGAYGENPVRGRIMIVAVGEEQLFYALAISPASSSGDGWEPEGRQEFEALIHSVSFSQPVLPDE
ncbi:MAG: hypothetical protein ACK2UM_04535 [Anaerolineales bacterium]|jgi:hypothetical protein